MQNLADLKISSEISYAKIQFIEKKYSKGQFIERELNI
jgi:hypothetical protein